MSIVRIISGGQTGVDQAALYAARDYGLETGGWAPKGWETETGPQEQLLRDFGLQEFQASGYPARTKANIDMANHTIVFGPTHGRGTSLTLRLCRARSWEHIPQDTSISFIQLRAVSLQEFARKLKDQLSHNARVVINVAGTRESKYPGIQADARHRLGLLFEHLRTL